PGVIGRKLNLDSHPVEIVGVAPASFYGLVVGRRFDVAVPICGQGAINGSAIDGDRSVLDVPYVWWLTVMGRLQPGWTVEKAAAQLNSVASSLFHDTLPAGWAGDRARQYLDFRFKILSAGNGVSSLREAYSAPLWLLLGIAGLVLLIACANLANLMLARASAREREIAVRLAVGASRARIIRQLLTESALIAVFGSILGFGLAQWVSRSLVFLISGEQNHLILDLKPDWPVLAFTAAVAISTCILFGLAPAFRATRVSPQTAMKAGSRAMTGSHESFGLRHGLVVSQVAMSLALLFGALLFTRTFRNLLVIDAGFQQTGILVTQLDFSQLNVPMENRAQYRRQIVERIRSLPGVDAATEVAVMPISGNGIGNDVWVHGTAESKKKECRFNFVGPGYFRTLGTSLLAGRDFSDSDTASSPKVAIVNEAFAKQFELPPNPVGTTFRREATSREPETDFQIVGLVQDTKYFDLREDFHAIAYAPFEQGNLRSADTQIAVRSTAAFGDLTAAIKRAMAEISPSVVISFRNFHSMVGESLLQERLMATLSTFFGLLAGILATVGLYGVISYLVVRRTSEIGIRIALGADRAGILAMILREAGTLVGIGIAAGVALSLIGARTAKTLLYGMKSYDPATMAVAIALLGIVSIAASALPARRASNLDPMVALREE
ncbi:MAG TPA: ABC transporter permease, partial [Terriglobales bacterium]|nr:ABC transporter permease [Terriglobales bacterium]